MAKYNIPYNLIEYCVENELLDTLYWYYKIRNRYKNNVFFKWSYRSMAREMGTSTSVAHRHIPKMLENKWIVIANGHLRLVSPNVLKSPESPMIQVPIESNKTAQIAQFRYVLIHRNLERQKDQIEFKSKIVKKARYRYNPLTKGELKAVSKAGGVKRFERSLVNRTTLSNNKIGKISRRSQSSGQRYQKRFRTMGLVKTFAFFTLIQSGVNAESFFHIRELYPKAVYSERNGMVYKQGSNTILPVGMPRHL